MFRSGAQLILLLLIAGLVLIHESRQEPLATCENFFENFLSTQSSPRSKPAPLTFVSIDSSSLADHPWPWTPLEFSLFFQSALPAKPAVLASNIILDWSRFGLSDDQQRKLPQYENILRDLILASPKVLLGAELGFPEDPTVIPPLQEVPAIRQVHGDLSLIPEFSTVANQPTENFRLSSTVGFTNLPTVTTQTNSVPLVLRYRGQVVPTFPLQAVMLWLRLTPDDLSLHLGSHLQIGPHLLVPIDPAGRMRVNFSSPFSRLPFDSLILASEQSSSTHPLRLDDQIVLLSRTDPATARAQIAPTRTAPSGAIFAAAIATIQNQAFIFSPPLWAHLLILAVFLFLHFPFPHWKKSSVLFIGLVSLVVYTMIALALFDRFALCLPITLPLGITLLSILIRFTTQKPSLPSTSP
ncbi:MAG: CHASE2 domain-containing protein [Verrucomicrobiota bacterium]